MFHVKQDSAGFDLRGEGPERPEKAVDKVVDISVDNFGDNYVGS
jgi:hypothetical protein